MAKKKKLSYWQMRNVDQEEYMQRGIDPVHSKIAKAYLQAQEYLTEEVNKLFKRARLKTDMTDEELKRALNQTVQPRELLEYQRLAKQIETPEIAKQAQNQLNMLAYKHRITLLEDLKAKSYLVAKQIADIEYKEQTNFYIDAIHDSYREVVSEDIIRKLEARGIEVQTWNKTRFSIPVEVWNENVKHEFKELSTQATKNILESHWKGSNYSKRIWKDTDTLAKRLEEMFTVEALTGMSNQEMVRVLVKEFDVSIGVANRLIRTEANYMSNQGKLKGMIARGIEKYQIVAVLDLRTSTICRHQDKKVYLVKDAEVGVNFPSFHPFCRSIAVPYFEGRSNNGIRPTRDPVTSEVMNMPMDASYNDWMNELRKKYSQKEIDLQKVKILNATKDNQDLKRLRNAIGKEAPKNLDDFQKLKYEDEQGYKELKKLYRRKKG